MLPRRSSALHAQNAASSEDATLFLRHRLVGATLPVLLRQ
jgi:hypothetical protein